MAGRKKVPDFAKQNDDPDQPDEQLEEQADDDADDEEMIGESAESAESANQELDDPSKGEYAPDDETSAHEARDARTERENLNSEELAAELAREAVIEDKEAAGGPVPAQSDSPTDPGPQDVGEPKKVGSEAVDQPPTDIARATTARNIDGEGSPSVGGSITAGTSSDDVAGSADEDVTEGLGLSSRRARLWARMSRGELTNEIRTWQVPNRLPESHDLSKRALVKLADDLEVYREQRGDPPNWEDYTQYNEYNQQAEFSESDEGTDEAPDDQLDENKEPADTGDGDENKE